MSPKLGPMGDVMITVGVDMGGAEADLDELKTETERVTDNWKKVRREVVSEIRKTMAVMRRVVHIVTDVLRQFGITLDPLSVAILEAGFAIVEWILSIEAAISAGTFGTAAAAAAVMGGIAIAGTVVAGFLAQNKMQEQKAAILRNADIIESVADIFEIVGFQD